jgi:hypothetical protein
MRAIMRDKPTLEQLDLGDGTLVWVQTIDADVPGRRLAGDEAPPRVQQALDGLKPAVQRVFASLKDLNNPKSIELEVGIGFSGKVGVFLASADTEATFKVKLLWENQDQT